MREAITKSQPSLKADQSVLAVQTNSEDQLSIPIPIPANEAIESSPLLNKSKPRIESIQETEEIERLKLSERQLSNRSGKSTYTFKKHRKSNPPGTPLELEIDGKPYKATCFESVKPRSPSKWVLEPA